MDEDSIVVVVAAVASLDMVVEKSAALVLAERWWFVEASFDERKYCSTMCC